MIVVHYGGAAGLTISNSDFDGKTEYSTSCDGHHYWGYLLLGKTTPMSLLGNYIHQTSGRSPKIGGTEGQNVVVHAANNYFEDNTGHAFDVATAAYVLAEGNYFSSVKTPNLEDAEGNFFVPSKQSDCKTTINRACQLNVLTESGTLKSNSAQTALAEIGKYSKEIGGYATTEATKLSAASSNFGVGELNSSSAAQSSTSGNTGAGSSTGSTATQETKAPTSTQVTQETTAPSTEAPSTQTTTEGSKGNKQMETSTTTATSNTESSSNAQQEQATSTSTASSSTANDASSTEIPLGTVSPYTNASGGTDSTTQWGDMMQRVTQSN